MKFRFSYRLGIISLSLLMILSILNSCSRMNDPSDIYLSGNDKLTEAPTETQAPPFLEYTGTEDSSLNSSDVLDSEEHSSHEEDTENFEVDLNDIFAKGYTDPRQVYISDKDGNAKNLICIYLESMETTYGSKMQSDGTNYIPNLTALADEYTSFSNGDGLGGFVSLQGSGWTMGALLATTSGIPFLLAETGENSNNSLGKDGTFLDGVVTLGDILEYKGYKQEFLCGSKASFGGRKTYFEVHGNYKIFDLQSARDAGYVAADYDNGFWGIEDSILYDIARDELTKLAEGDAPFNFTMLTVDTHHVGGYVCSECGDEYTKKLGNVVACADSQLYSFVSWCMEQDFYEDSVIVIMGDHPRMDSQLVKGVDFFDRTMYNCFINSAVEPEGDTKNRVFSSLDMFPTVLAAMGFEIKGNRLGLGTNVFSDNQTLCEIFGLEEIEQAVSLPSSYYREKFMLK